MTENYIPFSEPQYSITQTDITPYNPQSLPQVQQNKCIQYTHCYVCGKDWGWGYWKHCKCNTVPIGDSNITLIILLVFYSLYKYFKK